jgi:hypothetical protein
MLHTYIIIRKILIRKSVVETITTYISCKTNKNVSSGGNEMNVLQNGFSLSLKLLSNRTEKE